MNETVQNPVVSISKKEKVAKIIAIVIFSLVFSALLTALVSDIIIIGKFILTFIVAIFIAFVVFVVAFVIMMITIILVFGVYLLEQSGFFPLKWAAHVFNEILKENNLSTIQISEICIIRIVLLVICLIIFVSAIVALALIKNPKRKKGEPRIKTPKHNKLTKAFSTVSLIMSILGVFASLTVMFILSIAG